MYNSPIQMFQTEPILQELKDRIDKHIYTCIQQVGVDVDKQELIKALNYDRDQYNKGFQDGVESCQRQICELRTQLERMADHLRTMPFAPFPGKQENKDGRDEM